MMIVGIGGLVLCMLSSSAGGGYLYYTNTWPFSNTTAETTGTGSTATGTGSTTTGTGSTGSKMSITDLKEFETVPQFIKDIYNTEVVDKIMPALIRKAVSEQPPYTPTTIAQLRSDAAKSADAFVANINKPSTNITNKFTNTVSTPALTTTSSYMITPYGY